MTGEPTFSFTTPETGISIEVKIDDENYAKTPDTARLIEHHDQRRTWNHYLLLPKTNHEALRANIGSQLDDRETRSTLQGTQPDEPDVTVLYWRDISKRLRQTSSQTRPQHRTGKRARTRSSPSSKPFFASSHPPLITNASSGTTGFADQTRLRRTPLTDQYAYLTTAHSNE